jgi:molecular chaperone GrpE
VAANEEKGKNDKTEEKDPTLRVVDRRWWARGDVPEADASGARKPTYIEELEQRLDSTVSQLQAVTSDHRRSLEEFEQVKGRMRRDLGREVERGKRALLVELLEVLDNLDRAIAAPGTPASSGPVTQAPVAEEFERFFRGVELVRDLFLSKLESLGVVRMPALDLPFDAQKHEAVTTSPAADPSRDGIVVAIVKEGYAIGDEVLRPASVVVGKLE